MVMLIVTRVQKILWLQVSLRSMGLLKTTQCRCSGFTVETSQGCVFSQDSEFLYSFYWWGVLNLHSEDGGLLLMAHLCLSPIFIHLNCQVSSRQQFSTLVKLWKDSFVLISPRSPEIPTMFHQMKLFFYVISVLATFVISVSPCHNFSCCCE